MKKSLFAFVLLFALAACNLPGNTPTEPAPDAVFTQMAQTVAAELTRVAGQASPTPNISNTPTLTFTPLPSNTPIASPTKTPLPCLMVGFTDATIDVTVPDNTVMTPAPAFTKTWRLTNTGTCTWNSSYLLVFDHGDGMGVANAYTQPLTTGSVSPGQTVDVSVNLTAPALTGTYTGYWRFRDPNGVYFGIGGSSPWVVKIKVVATTTVTLLPVIGESGSARSDGSTTTSEFFAGDASTDKGLQMFLAYNISAIPSNATITEVKLDMRNGTILGSPFATLGVLNLFLQDFIPLDTTDYVPVIPSGGNLADWGTAAALNTVETSTELKSTLQAKLGGSRFQFRLQFQTGTDSDVTVDALQYIPTGGVLNNPALIIIYTTP